jgi:hypothetical protein
MADHAIRFKVTEVALMMDWEDSSGSSGNDEEMEDKWNLHKAVSNMRDTGSGNARGSLRGLQIALTEGWLIQRARDKCSFAHDRYRQAAQAEAENLPDASIAKMSFRVSLWYFSSLPMNLAQLSPHQDYLDDATRNPHGRISDSGTCQTVGPT